MADDIFAKYAVEEPSAGSRALSGFLRTTPFNPANIVEAIKHPIDTLNSMTWNPLADLLRASQAPSVGEGLKTMARGVPFIGAGAVNAGERMAEGDVAGGLGELGGIASGFAVPEIAGRVLPKVPAGVAKVGQMMEKGGSALKKPVSLMGMAETLHNPAVGVPAMAAPYALEAAGKGVQAAGRGLESLKNRMSGKPTEVAAEGSSNARGYRRQSTEIPYRHQGELPATETPEISADTRTPMQKFYDENPMGAGRLTGLGQEWEVPGSLRDLTRMREQQMGPKLGPKTFEEGLPEVPDFEFEGSAGEGLPPSAGDFSLGEFEPEVMTHEAPSGPPSAGGSIGDMPSLEILRRLQSRSKAAPEAPLADPAAELARRLGTPADIDVLTQLVNRARTGTWDR